LEFKLIAFEDLECHGLTTILLLSCECAIGVFHDQGKSLELDMDVIQ
jgi:hypothetical protein